MKICQIITTLELGGAETLLANFSTIHAQSHEVLVIYLKGEPKIVSMFSEQITVKHIPLGWNCASQIRELLIKWNPDVIHTHLGHADLIGLWAARGLHKKTFCTMHNIYFKWNWLDNVIFFVYQLYFSTIAKNCQVVCISKVVQEHVQKILKVKVQNTHLLYNGIPDIQNQQTKEEARKALGIGSEKRVLLFVGRLEKQKAVHVLLNALPQLNDISNLQLEIVGTGSLKLELENQVSELGLNDRVNFRGNTLNVQDFYTAADVFVLPSIFEGLGIVLLEAFRAKLPVVASNVEGPSELIEHDRNGLLFDSENSTQLADLIRKLYHSPELMKRLGIEAHIRFQGKFKIKTYAEKLEQFYLGNK